MPSPAAPDFFVGLDLGQAHDPSAVALLERKEMPQPQAAPPKKKPGKRPPWHFACRGLKRWALGTSYPAIVKEVGELLSRPPFTKKTTHLVIDATGVGRPVYDLFTQAKLPVQLVPVIITAGHKETHQDGYYHVAKVILVSTAQVLLQEHRVQFATAIPETAALVKELENYRVKITPAANETFNAREGEYDDLILALALAAWQGERIPKPGLMSFAVLRPPADVFDGLW